MSEKKDTRTEKAKALAKRTTNKKYRDKWEDIFKKDQKKGTEDDNQQKKN